MATGRIPGTSGSPLTAKGDIFAYSTTAARLPVGADGTTLVANSASATGIAWAGPIYTAGKNFLINGGFDIWQRGTSFGPNGYTADRWYMTQSGGTTAISQESTIVPAGSRYSLKVAQTVASGNTYVFQAIETANTVAYAGQTVTVSAYVAASASTAVSFNVGYSTTVDNSVNGSYTTITATSGGSGTVSTTASFTRISGVYAIPSTAKTIQIILISAPASGTSVYWGQAQMEVGSSASQFSRAGGTIQGELAACQRYYWRVANGASGAFMNAHYYSTTQINGTITYPVTMRTTPTLDSISGSGYYLMIKTGTNNSLNSFTLGSDTNSSTGSIFNNTQASGVAGYAGYLYSGNAAGYVGFSAEL